MAQGNPSSPGTAMTSSGPDSCSGSRPPATAAFSCHSGFVDEPSGCGIPCPAQREGARERLVVARDRDLELELRLLPAQVCGCRAHEVVAVGPQAAAGERRRRKSRQLRRGAALDGYRDQCRAILTNEHQCGRRPELVSESECGGARRPAKRIDRAAVRREQRREVARIRAVARQPGGPDGGDDQYQQHEDDAAPHRPRSLPKPVVSFARRVS